MSLTAARRAALDQRLTETKHDLGEIVAATRVDLAKYDQALVLVHLAKHISPIRGRDVRSLLMAAVMELAVTDR